jgi:hypothetical protein
MSVGDIHEAQVPFKNDAAVDEQLQFAIVVENVPVGATIGFSASSPTRGGQTIGGAWIVPPPPGGGSVQPNFAAGQIVTVEAGYSTVLTYSTDFAGHAVPANFQMEMRVTMAISP